MPMVKVKGKPAGWVNDDEYKAIQKKAKAKKRAKVPKKSEPQESDE